LSNPAFYTGYPGLERIAHARKDPRLKPAWLLRYWYLLQGEARELHRADLYPLWEPIQSDRTHMCNALRLGDDVFWRRLGTERVEVFSPEELHQRHGLLLTTRQRPYDDLYLKIREWHRSLVEDAVARHVRPEGGTDPLSQEHLARQLGLSRRTVQRGLRETRRFRVMKVWLAKDEGACSVVLQRRRRQASGYFRHLGPFRLVAQRLPNRYLPERSDCPVLPHPEPLSTSVGRLLRQVADPLQIHPHYGEVWLENKVAPRSCSVGEKEGYTNSKPHAML
jgi:AraC-like DNA-binding protein